MNCSPPGSSVHGIYPARILAWVAVTSSRGSCQTPGSNPCLRCLLYCRRYFTAGPVGEARSIPGNHMFLYSKFSPLLSACCHGKYPSERIPRLEITFKITSPVIYVTLTSSLESHGQMVVQCKFEDSLLWRPLIYLRNTWKEGLHFLVLIRNFATIYCNWRRKWQPTPVFLPGESHGGRSLVGYSPRGHKESDTTERLHVHFHCNCALWGNNKPVSLVAQLVKNLPAVQETPGLGRSPGEGNGNPLQYPCLENLIDRGAWWAAVHGVTKSPMRLSS